MSAALNAVPTPTAGAAAAAVRRIGRFRLLRELGRGAQATVWLAHDPRLAREVALKLFHPAADAHAVSDWLPEAHSVSRLTHPHIVPVWCCTMRGAMSAMLAVEGVRRAQERFGKGKWVSAEQARWGYENLALDQKKLDALGFAGVMRPLSTSCVDHMGSNGARVHTWDGKKWNFSSDWLQADEQILKPLVKATAAKYAADKKLTPRTPADCQS